MASPNIASRRGGRGGGGDLSGMGCSGGRGSPAVMIVRGEQWREGSGGAGEKGGRAVDLLPLGGDGAKHWLRGGGGPNGERGGSSGGGSALGCGGLRRRQWAIGGMKGAPVVVQREEGRAVDGWLPRRGGGPRQVARRRWTEWEEGLQRRRRRARRGSLR